MQVGDTAVLAFLMRRFRGALLVATLASLASGACSVLLVTQINAALTSGASRASEVGLRFAAAALAAMLTGMFARILFQRLRERASAELREFISSCVINAPFRHLEQVAVARIQTTLSEHTACVAEFFVNIPTLLTNGAIVVGCLIYLVTLSPRIFLVTLPFVAFGALGYHLAHLRAIGYLRAGMLEQDRLFAHFQSLTAGAKELRLNRAKRRLFSQNVLHRSIESVRRQRATGMSLFIAASSWGNFLIYAFLGIVLFLVAGNVPDRVHVLTGFALVMVYLVGPLQSLLLSLPEMNQVRVAAEQIGRLTQDVKSPEPPSRDEPVAAFRRLTLEGVKHRYYHEQSNELFELGPVDLTFRPGEITFIVGGNGSGKTTLAKVLVGLYPPEEGALLLNDERIDDSNRDQYRQQFSAIFADFHLFESLLEEQAPELNSRVSRLLARLELQHKVQMRDGAFSTLALSHGQRKRLALVVACLEDRPILVFDEWAADQDPLFKEVFYYELLAELRARGKTAIVISHDDRYFHVADRIIRLESGRVLAVDTREKRVLEPNSAAEVPSA